MRRKPAAPRNINTKACVRQAAKEIVWFFFLPKRKMIISLGITVLVKQHSQVSVPGVSTADGGCEGIACSGRQVCQQGHQEEDFAQALDSREALQGELLDRCPISHYHQHFFPQILFPQTFYNVFFYIQILFCFFPSSPL